MARVYRSCGSNVLIEEFNALRSDLDAIRAVVDDLVIDMAEVYEGDALLSDPNLAIGTGDAAKIKHAAFTYRLDGVTHDVATAEVAFTAITHDIADPDANPREAIYTISVDAAETVTITKGDDAAAGAAVAPATPAGHVKLGEVKVQHNGSAIFDATTDLLSAAHLTDTYTDNTPEVQQSSAPAALTAQELTK